MTDWKEGQEAVYVFSPEANGRRVRHTTLVPIIITEVLPTQVHARHLSRNRQLRFLPKEKLRPKGYNGVYGEEKKTKETRTRRETKYYY